MKPSKLLLNKNASKDSQVLQDEISSYLIPLKRASKSSKRENTEESPDNSIVNLLEKMDKKDEKNTEKRRKT